MTLGKGIEIDVALLVELITLIKLAAAISWFQNAMLIFADSVFGFIMNRFV